MDKLDFKEWLEEVDERLIAKTGVTHDDLSDQPWSDWAEDGMKPDEAVKIALQYEGWKDR